MIDRSSPLVFGSDPNGQLHNPAVIRRRCADVSGLDAVDGPCPIRFGGWGRAASRSGSGRSISHARPLLGPMLASEALLAGIRRTVVAASILLAALSLTVGNSRALSAGSTTARAVTGILAAGGLVAAVWMLRSRAPLSGRGAIVIGVFADLGVVAMVGLIDDALYAAFAVFALVLPGVFVMVHLGRVWLVAHLALAFVVIILLGLRLALRGPEPVPVAVAGVVLAVAVVVVTPWTMRRTFLHILDRAERAFRDPVTGVLNRWGLDAALSAVRQAPPSAPVSVVVVDIDRFKAVNDVRGHDAGDRTLRAVADDLRRFAGARGGIVARTGGEEFAVVVPGTIDDLSSIPAGSGRVDAPAVTLSAGVVVASAGALDAEGAAPVLVRADRLMYEAKRAGGGRAERGGRPPGP